jgi:hypothetical protein
LTTQHSLALLPSLLIAKLIRIAAVNMDSSNITHGFGYDALPTEQSIGLFDLQVSSDGKVVTTLHTHSLDDTPALRALSYILGEPYRNIRVEDVKSPLEFVASISCNGQQSCDTKSARRTNDIREPRYYGTLVG